MVLNDSDIIDILNNIGVSDKTLNETINAYDMVKYQEVNKNKTYEELSSTIEAIAFNIEFNGYATPEEASREFSDNKHITYFDHFGESGLSNDIVKVLNDNGVGTDILKGIKSFQDQSITDQNTGYEVKTHWEKIPPDSIVLMWIEIYDNKNNLIFKWERN